MYWFINRQTWRKNAGFAWKMIPRKINIQQIKSEVPCHHNKTTAGVVLSVVAEYVQMRHRVPRQPGQLKEQTRFLVSRSLTLPSAPPWAATVFWWFFLYPIKKHTKTKHYYFFLIVLQMVMILFTCAILLFFCRSPQIFYGWGDFIPDYFKLNDRKL